MNKAPLWVCLVGAAVSCFGACSNATATGSPVTTGGTIFPDAGAGGTTAPPGSDEGGAGVAGAGGYGKGGASGTGGMTVF